MSRPPMTDRCRHEKRADVAAMMADFIRANGATDYAEALENMLDRVGDESSDREVALDRVHVCVIEEIATRIDMPPEFVRETALEMAARRN